MDKHLVANFLSLAVVYGSQYLAGLLTLPYLVRVLGPVEFGLYSFAFAITQILCVITDYGFGLTASRALANCRDDLAERSRVFWNTLLARSFLGVACFAALIALCLWVPKCIETRGVLFPFFLMVVGAMLLPNWLFTGLERTGALTTATCVAKIVYVPLVFLAVRSSDDAAIAALLQGIAAIFGGALAIALAVQRGYVNFVVPSPREALRLLQGGWHIFLVVTAVSVFNSALVIILRMTSTLTDVAEFAAVDKLRSAAGTPSMILAMLLLPRTANLFSRSRGEAASFVKRMLPLQWGLGASVTVFLLLFADPLIHLLFGAKLEAAAMPLRIVSLFFLFRPLCYAFGEQTLVVNGQERAFSAIGLAGSVVGLASAVPLCWWFGANGAAAVVTISEVVFSSAFFAFVLWRGLLATESPGDDDAPYITADAAIHDELAVETLATAAQIEARDA